MINTNSAEFAALSAPAPVCLVKGGGFVLVTGKTTEGDGFEFWMLVDLSRCEFDHIVLASNVCSLYGLAVDTFTIHV